VSLEFFIAIKSFRSHCGPGVDSASNRNEYQEHFLGGKGDRCVRLTTLPPSCAVVMKSGNLNFLEPSGPLQACNGDCFTFAVIVLCCYSPPPPQFIMPFEALLSTISYAACKINCMKCLRFSLVMSVHEDFFFLMCNDPAGSIKCRKFLDC